MSKDIEFDDGPAVEAEEWERRLRDRHNERAAADDARNAAHDERLAQEARELAPRASPPRTWVLRVMTDMGQFEDHPDAEDFDVSQSGSLVLLGEKEPLVFRHVQVFAYAPGTWRRVFRTVPA